MNWNGFRGLAKKLDDIDLPKLGARLGVGEDELHAFIDVETAGSGFDRSGRPLMLPERHYFYKLLRGEELQTAIKAGLAYKNQGAKPYPVSADERYRLLEKMMAINETAALKSCSWGIGQVMGNNHAAAGYDTVQEMVQAAMADEEAQLEMSVNFILTNRLDDELRAHDWPAFAKGYNGSGYRQNRYDTKLATAFAKWKRIKDTPYSAAKEVEKIPAEKPAQTPAPVPTPAGSDDYPFWLILVIVVGLIAAAFLLRS